jgi:hypothetical protein
MKRSFVFYLKTTLLLMGAALILLAAFSPVESQYQYLNQSGEFEDAVKVVTTGFNHILWYVLVFGTAVVFSVGYFFNRLVNKVLVYVFTPLFALIFLFFTAITTITWGATPFIPRLQYGYLLMVYGSVLVLTATIISVHRGTPKTISNDKDLLDDSL